MTQAVSVANPPKAKEVAIESLLAKTGFRITLENGQRKYGPHPDGNETTPPRGCEVFIGKVPRDMYEDELVPIVEKIGKIHEMRLMMDPNGCNRGYAFVMYTNPEDAKRAIKELDNTEVRRGRFIGVCKSVDNCRLFVGGIPRNKNKQEILEEMKQVTEQVSDVILYSSISDKSKNRGFAFVEYENHKAAAIARRKLMPGKIQLFGQDIAVDWAEPELEVDEAIMSKVTVLYVRNLMPTTTEEKIRDSFSLENTLRIEKVKKLRDFAFVHYRSREDAEKAMEELNETNLEGSVIEVTWAKPVDRNMRPRNRSPVPPNATTYSPFVYGHHTLGDPYSGHIILPPCPVRTPMFQRMPLARRGRGAAGVRRFRNYIPASSNHSGGYKPIDASYPPLHPPYGQYQVTKLGRIPEESKVYHQTEYPVYVQNNSAAEGGPESAMTSTAGPPLPPYPTYPRIGQGFIPMPAAYDESGYYAYLSPPPPPPPGSVPMY